MPKSLDSPQKLSKNSSDHGNSGGNGTHNNKINSESKKRARVSTVESTQNELHFRDLDMNKTIERYENKLELLEQKIADLENSLSKSKDRESKLEKYSLVLEKQLENISSNGSLDGIKKSGNDEELSNLLKFYEIMTSMKVEMNNQEYICTLKNKLNKRATRFILRISPNEYDFIPKANMSMLPDYLQKHISFDPNMAPVITGDILQNLYEDTDN
jgi:hypothetical protein